MRLHGAAGLGCFKPENIDAAFGVSPGIGLDWGITPKLRVEAAARYFHLFTDVDAIGFLGLSAGVRYIIPLDQCPRLDAWSTGVRLLKHPKARGGGGAGPARGFGKRTEPKNESP